jgi:uncharacterized protein (TIGR02246 family)
LKRLPFGMRGLTTPTIEAFYRRGLLDNIAMPEQAQDAAGLIRPLAQAGDCGQSRQSAIGSRDSLFKGRTIESDLLVSCERVGKYRYACYEDERMFEGSESDRLAIRELIDSYGDAVVRRDPVAWGATWAANGTWQFAGRSIAGRSEIVATWHGAMARYEKVVFLAFPGMIAVEGDRAAARTHTYEHLVPIEGPARVQAGIYEDDLIREDGRWLFASRRFTPTPIA